MNIYSDVDGVILSKSGTQKPHLREFLLPLFEKHAGNIYWLTTHCKENDTRRVLSHLKTNVEEDLFQLLFTVKPTTWSTLKTEGIDFTQPFQWYDDYILEAEKEVLKKHNCLESWIYVNPLQ